MLIACVGPDLYRALEKARELEAAFRQKYDPDGSSTEHLHEEGTELVDELAKRVNTVSLFTPRRFLVVRDLLNSCPKGRIGVLEKALVVDPENVIVVSVEKDIPPDGALKIISALPKYIQYDFSRLDTRAFEGWIRDRAAKLSCMLSDEEVHEIADFAQGDSWQAMFALLARVASGGVQTPVAKNTLQDVRSPFDLADAYIKADPTWWLSVDDLGAETLVHPFLSQLRAYLRVQDGEEGSLPPFVARKLKGMPSSEAEERFVQLVESIWLQRQGFLREDELAALF